LRHGGRLCEKSYLKILMFVIHVVLSQ
jgi:hypothetical protein